MIFYKSLGFNEYRFRFYNQGYRILNVGVVSLQIQGCHKLGFCLSTRLFGAVIVNSEGFRRKLVNIRIFGENNNKPVNFDH